MITLKRTIKNFLRVNSVMKLRPNFKPRFNTTTLVHPLISSGWVWRHFKAFSLMSNAGLKDGRYISISGKLAISHRICSFSTLFNGQGVSGGACTASIGVDGVFFLQRGILLLCSITKGA